MFLAFNLVLNALVVVCWFWGVLRCLVVGFILVWFDCCCVIDCVWVGGVVDLMCFLSTRLLL